MADAGIGRHGTCAQCAAPFAMTKPNRRYCSEKCLRKTQSAKGIKRQFTCEGCGQGFRPQRTDRTRFCSRQCNFASQKADAALRKQERASMSVRRCGDCAAEIGPRRRYCPACLRVRKARWRVKAHAPRPLITRPCAGCGQTITGTAGKTKCARCAKAAYRRIRKHRHRAKHYGCHYEPVDPIKVFDRDGWRCQLCGRKTMRRLRGTCEPLAPELDHIVPLSAGGEHSYRNTQCACRACNTAKGAKPMGQMRLIG